MNAVLEIRVTHEFKKFELYTTRAYGYGSLRNSKFEADVFEIQLKRGKMNAHSFISISELTFAVMSGLKVQTLCR